MPTDDELGESPEKRTRRPPGLIGNAITGPTRSERGEAARTREGTGRLHSKDLMESAGSVVEHWRSRALTFAGRAVPVALAGGLLVFYPFVVKSPFWQNLAVLALITASAAAAWNLLGGFMGQISFGHSIFFGIGAYSTAFLLVRHDLLPWVGIAVGMAISIVAAIVIGIPVFRLRRHYFSIATIAVQQAIFIVVVNTESLGRATGLELPIKPESLANLRFSIRDLVGYHLVALAFFAVTTLAVWLYKGSL